MKRIFSVILCVVLVLSLAACGSNTIASVDNLKVDRGFFEYYFNQLKAQLESELGEETWETAEYEGKSALDYAKERALQSAVEDVIVTERAKSEGIKFNNDDIKSMGTLKNQWISYYGGEDGFKKELEKYGITTKQFDYMLDAAYYKNHLIDKYTEASDEEALNYYNDNIVKVKHILVLTVDPSTNAKLGEDEIVNAKQKIDRILQSAKNGEDFDSLVAEYTEDQDKFYYVGEGFALSDDGTESGKMVSEFETAALALNPGEISDVVTSQYGYHIIKRYDNDDEMFENAKDTLISKVRQDKFTDILNEWKSKMKIVVNEDVYNSYK